MESLPHSSRGICCSYLKSTAKWFFDEKYKYEIKNLKVFKDLKKIDFKSKKAQQIRDNHLSKKHISFLHQGYRYRGKFNYRDAPFISFANQLYTNAAEFIDHLTIVLEDFIKMSIAYCQKRVGDDEFKLFLNDINDNSNFEPQTKNIIII